ncbi:hypothetical protein KKH07_01715 [Patescibacteria group bacterium]|nr:hypothetical protein [Patescibacteria group bacterium]MBU1563475.1 hypothetical protein [Patescibacteria group bacterium]MBU2067997.1 hypothetical protein [Patescibacteria group bacterium]
MSKRTNKQIFIALIFLLILIGIGFLIYSSWIKPKPSCFDGIQNQEEEKIDCGGSCQPCELVNIKNIEVISVKVVSSQNNFYDLAAKIKNPNQNYGSGKVPYQFELYDSQDNLIVQYSGLTYILPNQTKYLLKIKTESNKPVKQVKISFNKIDWEKLETYQPPQLGVQEKEYRLLSDQESGFAQVKAMLINKTNFDFDKIDIDILLFDSYNRLLAINTNELRTFLAGQERDFLSTWFNQISGQVNLIEIEAETNIFDSDNYLSGTREKERFQEY